MKRLDEIGAGFVRAIELILNLDPAVVEITVRSLLIALASTTIAAAIAVPIGGLIHFHNFWGKRAAINVIQTLYSLPTVTVGLLVFLLLSRSGPLGGFGLLFTPAGMVIGQTILIVPIMTGLTIAALSGIADQVRDSAVSLGASKYQAIFTIMGEARAAMMAAVLLGFGRALSEVGVAMMIGGNIRGYTRVLTTAIALETSRGDIEFSMALGIILVSISLIVNLLVNRVQGRWWA
ncbi:ABC transporter permease [Methanotrichaceae archaeon M04Ac]|uniref:ABC transporter permease n=1 Tax=Candidatus Methanocrinis alkalitolerans TaxID=3033395 RepID=A0ABT5XDR4_9EURY|nr:ABC transporter permease [Candidatus Methanocrinis alkalitolerans]MCR3883744.1 ABC transporter permease [Methanothrix sp.]MDF0592791.1 ABC transporter permease [Candidatus Methanocrinis alkalitolerans]